MLIFRTRPVPFFWTASLKAKHGGVLVYQRNLWHTKRFVSLNAGSDLGWWSRGSQNQYSLSVFLALKFWPFHTQYFNPYFFYSIAGPSLISRVHFGGRILGTHMLFQDVMGVGAQFGVKRAVTVSAKIWHFSNGDIFTPNPGFGIPLVISLGYVF